MRRMNCKEILKLSIFMLITGLFACNPERQPIAYGQDKCEFCRMSIVDQRFACEIVTTKDKALKFDAVECMVNYIDEHIEDEAKIKLFLTNTFDNPGQLADATLCIYLKSENMPSPMGMNINPFESTDKAIEMQKQNTGTLMDWNALRADFVKYK